MRHAMTLLLFLGLVGALAAGLAPTAGKVNEQPLGASWPMYRGNLAHTGTVSGSDTLPGPGPTTNPGLLWSFDLGGPALGTGSSPAVVDATVYVGGGDGNIYALKYLNGEERWHFPTGGPVYSSPAVSDGRLYIGSDDGYLYALDAVTGALRWRFKTGGAVKSSPAVADDIVYFGSSDGTFYAVDAATGEERWQFLVDTDHLGVDVNADPVVADGTVYFGSDDGFEQHVTDQGMEYSQRNNIFALDAATGEERWQFWTGSEHFLARVDVTTSLAVVDGVLYISSLYVHALDAATGEVKWRFHHNTIPGYPDYPNGMFTSNPVIVDGTVYVGNEGGEWDAAYKDPGLFALNAATGRVKWHFATPGPIHTAPTVVDGVVYAASGGGTTYAIDAAKGSERWRFSNGPSLWPTSPAVYRGILFTGYSDGEAELIAIYET